ncbi:MAG: MerR family transcriptional regulator [Actinomycetota bacterium]|nr:MerR family transcriptional regulator [Actinomycetota bacterium]MDA3012948.1 MerR family transcriptional regulator [Actinomycetota bacterium]
MKKNAFTSKQACYLSGCTSHQLRYWDKVGLVSPSVQSSEGKPGVPKFYSFRDIVALRVIKTLLDNGMSIQRVRRAWKYLSKNGDLIKHLSEVKLMSDGNTIYSVQDNEVFDALKYGQLTFFETIDNITQDVKEDVSKFELDKDRFLNLLTRVEEDVLNQQLEA